MTTQVMSKVKATGTLVMSLSVRKKSAERKAKFVNFASFHPSVPPERPTSGL